MEIEFPVMVSEIKVYENYYTGSIKAVWVSDGLGHWENIWGTPTVQALSYSRLFSLNVSVLLLEFFQFFHMKNNVSQ